jgi:hypothetical protein
VSEADPNDEPGFASQTMSNAAESLSAPTADLARPDTFGAESDEPAGFHSVLAQLMPPAPVEIPQFGGELNGSAALIADHQEAFEMPQPETLPAQREAAELPVASGEPQADSQSQSEATLAPALSIEEAASLLNPDTRDENVPATIEELPVAGASQLEAQTVNSQESESQPVAPAQNGHEPRAEEVAEAIERVLARFKESLISEVMREFSTK